MMNKRVLLGSIFVAALAMTAISFYKMNDSSKSSASVTKNSDPVGSQSALSYATYNGENMFVAKATFYDYYSDSQVGTDAVPKVITDGTSSDTKNTFSKFNKRLYDVMQYGNTSLSPARYPMYQGSFPWGGPTDLTWLFKNVILNHNKYSNFWIVYNCDQGDAAATIGLVDSKLVKDSYGVDTLSQSNYINGKSSLLPFFDKKFLTTTKFEGSNLPLGKVIENVNFPFRRVVSGDDVSYEFYSRNDAVRFNASNQLEYKGYNQSADQVANKSGKIGFYPYNSPSDSGKASLNYGHGLKIEIPFAMTKDGKFNGKDMVFEFSGDDDVWVFVDGYLALDLGGSHQPIGGTINFAQGKSNIEKIKNMSVAFSSHSIEEGVTKVENYMTPFPNELKEKLKNTDEIHTLTFFYMERGMGGSNFNVKFNLPEPSKLTVKNKVDVEKVGKTFKDETSKIASKEVFLYDVVDKTNNKKHAIDMISGDYVLFTNEFNINDNILLEEKALKDATRKLTELYETSWDIKDLKAEIAKGKGVIVKDSRTNNSTLLFKNLNNNNVPMLTSTYVNSPLINTFYLKCNVSDKYKENNPNYKDKSFKYNISYKNVFGGGSKEQAYIGKYKLTTSDGSCVEKETSNGIIELKPGDKIEITAIPVLTEIFVKVTLDKEGDYVGGIKTTDQFVYDLAKGTSSGKINIKSNVVEYTIFDKVDNATDKGDKSTDEEVANITGEDKLTDEEVANIIGGEDNTEPNKQEDSLANDKEKYDNLPKTGDESNVRTWAIVMCGSLLLTIGMAIMFIKSKYRK